MGLDSLGASVANVATAPTLIVAGEAKFDNGTLSNGARAFVRANRPGHGERNDVGRQLEANSLHIALAQAQGALFLGRRASSGGPHQGQPLRSGNLRVALTFVLALKLVKALGRNLVSHFLHPGATQRASPVKILYLATAREPFVASYLWQLALATAARIHVMCLNGAQVASARVVRHGQSSHLNNNRYFMSGP